MSEVDFLKLENSRLRRYVEEYEDVLTELGWFE